MTAARVFKLVNLVGFIAFAATAFLASVPAAWRVGGVLAVVDGIFLFAAGSTEVLGPTTRAIRGAPAYFLAALAVLVGIALFLFAADLYCIGARGKSDLCS